jgi:hypothetical protein
MGRRGSRSGGDNSLTRRKKASTEVVIVVDFPPLCYAFEDWTGPVLCLWGIGPILKWSISSCGELSFTHHL